MDTQEQFEQLDMFSDVDLNVEDRGYTENPQDMTLVIREPEVSSPIENWARKELNQNRPMAGIFKFEDNINVMDAWDSVGGNRYGVTTRPAEALLSNGNTLVMNDRRWLFPTWDGNECYVTDKNGELRKSISMVSDHFEVVQPSDAIKVLYENMVDNNGQPLNVTAIASTPDLREVIIQWQTGTVKVGKDLVNRYVAARVAIVGSIIGAFFDVRFTCLNKMPLLMSNAQFAITHRTGANERLQNRFSGMMGMFQIAQGLHEESYNVLTSIDMDENDQKYIAEKMYPYQLPKGYNQSVNSATVRQLVYEGRAPRKNLKLMEYRALARFGIQQAIEENGRSSLWEGSQANFAANHRMTRSYAAQATQLAFQGGERRDEAVRGFQAALVLASEKGYRDRIPAQMMTAAKNNIMLDSYTEDNEQDIIDREKQIQMPIW